MAHLCGLCLTLRDLHGQNARFVTNYDGLLVSVLMEAQNPALAPHRTAGPCALRGFRRSDVLDAAGAGARLAASVSLVLAAAKVRDHVADGDGACRSKLVAAGARVAAWRWQSAGERTGAEVGFDTAVLTDAIGRQAVIEQAAGTSLLDVTEPSETAVSAAFAHTAALAGRPDNADALAVAGRNFGRIAHLLDAVEDLPADRSAGSYNPLFATGTSPEAAHELCAEALAGLRGSVAALDLAEPVLTESLLVREVGVAADRVFADAMARADPSGKADLPGGPDAMADQQSGPGLRSLTLARLPCLAVACCRRDRPRYQPGQGRPPRRCGDWCEDCGCCCDACEACGDCGGCCDCPW